MTAPFKGLPMRHRGAVGRKTDQIFTVEGIGTFNISKIKRAFETSPHWFEVELTPITDELAAYVRRRNDPLEGYAASITLAQVRARQLIAIVATRAEADEKSRLEAEREGKRLVQLVDGNHAILAAHRLGVPHLPSIIVPVEVRPRFELWFEVFTAGAWRKVTPEEILAATHGKIYSKFGG
jgi:hypothetical protein